MRARLLVPRPLHEDAEGPALAPQGLTPPLLLAVVGPTASGKTDLALALADRLRGEVVSADMGQLYRHLDAGTAKPEGEARARVRLLDVLDPAEPSDAGRYARLAQPAVEDALARGRLPIVAGGTGLYLRALIDGLDPLPPRDAGLRARLERRPLEDLGAELARRDPAAAARIDARNRPRVVRALEVIELTGRPLSAQWTAPARPPRFRAVYVALERGRDELRARIRDRAERMFPAMVEETRRLVPARYRGDEPGFRCLGYAQALAAARGELGMAAGLETMVEATNAYARRQLTWFRRQTPSAWLSPAAAESEAARLVEEAR